MRYHPIDNQLFVANRKRFADRMKPKSIAVFHSSDIYPTSADGTMPFKQHSDIFYLTGVDQEESILVIYPDSKSQELKEVLFVRETNEHIAVWEGAKLDKKQATEVSGIKNVQWLDSFDAVFRSIVFEVEHIYLTTNEHSRAASTAMIETRDDRFRKSCMAQFPLHKYERSAPILHAIRAIKSPQEVALIQEACNITEKGFRRLLEFVKPGVWEFEVEAELWHQFVRNRSRGFAYEPIIASGGSSCVLHYVSNNKQCQDGDVLLMDIGAEYANYASDMTRVLPVSGRFTERQKQVYNAVLHVMKEAIKMLVPGDNHTDYTAKVGRMVEGQLIDLGLLKKHEVAKQDPKKPLYKKYFMHGVSHHLGINVHDYGNFKQPFEAGMVFTCEPGIYIPEENIGIRLENDILITDNGPFDLMGSIPLEVEEIEDLMNQN